LNSIANASLLLIAPFDFVPPKKRAGLPARYAVWRALRVTKAFLVPLPESNLVFF
jgi:hypothetical protein